MRILGTGKGNSVSHQPLLAGSSSAARAASGCRSRTAVAAARPRWTEADLLDAWHVTARGGVARLLPDPEKAWPQPVAAAAAGGALRPARKVAAMGECGSG